MTTQTRQLLWCVLLGAGCGSVASSRLPDGGTGNNDAAAPVTVQLSVLTETYDGLPDTTAIAVFQDPSGALIVGGTVDATGHAQADMPFGGSVTVIRVVDVSATERTIGLTTIKGIKPGDQLTVGTTASPSRFAATGTALTASYTALAGNFDYSFATPCGPGVGTALTVFDACHNPALSTIDVLAVAATADASDIRYVYQPGTPIAGATVAVPNAWREEASFTANVIGIPSGLSAMTVSHLTIMGSTVATQNTASVPAASLTASALPVTMLYPEAGASTVLTTGLRNGNPSAFQVVDVRTNEVSNTEDLDLSQDPLPWINSTVSSTATGMSWTQAGSGTPDARITVWTAQLIDSTPATTVTWTVEDGEQTSSTVLPSRLPDAYAAYDPHNSSVGLDNGLVYYVAYSNLDGYDAARPYGPNLMTPRLSDLGVFVGQPLQRRISYVVNAR